MHTPRRHPSRPHGATSTAQTEATRRKTGAVPRLETLAALILAIALALFASACNSNTNNTTTAIATCEPLPPVAIGALLDKTESAPEYAVPAPKIDAFSPIINLVRARGGDFRVAEITGLSPDTMVRLRVAPPPTCPPSPLADTTGNAFVDQELIAAYETRKASFDGAYSRWQATADADTTRFQENLQRLLSKPASAKHTDIFNALNRAAWFLTEPQVPGQAPASRYLLLVTDGRDNVHAAPVNLPPDIRVLLVNGGASVGALESLHPLRFESLAAAVDFIVRTEAVTKEQMR